MHSRKIDWLGRGGALIATFLLDNFHADFFGSPENTRAGVTIYLASAALVNLTALVIYYAVVGGKLSFDLQRIAYSNIVLNFLAWTTYLAQKSPELINLMIMVITYGTYIRILWISNGDSDAGSWRDLLHRHTSRRMGRNTKRAQQ